MGATGSARWFCYLLACADGSLYAGITTALDRRLAAHNAGSASKYTRARRPVRLVWVESCRDRAAASRREAAVKALPRALKLALAETRPATPPPRAAAGAPPRHARPGRGRVRTPR
jgi:putative endonuclease